MGLGDGLLLDTLEHLRQGGLVHCQKPFRAHTLQQTCNGRVVQLEPVVFSGYVDVAEADLLGWELELGSAVRPFALLNQALLVQRRKQRRTITALSVSCSAMSAEVCMVLGSDANTVKILRLSPKRPLCAMQSKLPHQGLIRLPPKYRKLPLRGRPDNPGFPRHCPGKCYSLQE